nr:polysaccharide biosynthesis protein [Cohnella cholangitidis]
MLIQELDARSTTLFSAVRFGNVLGSRGSVIPLFKKQIEHGGPVTVTHPDMVRYFMTIPEAVQLVIQAGAITNGGETFILDMGKPVKISDLAFDLIRLSGLEPNKDINVVYTGIRPGEKLFEEILSKDEGASATKHDRIYVGIPQKVSGERLKRLIAVFERMDETDDVRIELNKIVPSFKWDNGENRTENLRGKELLHASLEMVAALEQKPKMKES